MKVMSRWMSWHSMLSCLLGNPFRILECQDQVPPPNPVKLLANTHPGSVTWVPATHLDAMSASGLQPHLTPAVVSTWEVNQQIAFSISIFQVSKQIVCSLKNVSDKSIRKRQIPMNGKWKMKWKMEMNGKHCVA